MGPNQFKLWEIPAVVRSIVVVGALTCCALIHFMRDFKATQIQCSQEIMIYEFKYKTVEATKNICYAKDEDAVARWFKKFYSGCKNLND